MFTAFLIKYAEIGVKGKNRYLFEDALVQQIKYALKRCEGEFKVRKTQGRIYVDAVSEFDFDETVSHLQRVFGISGICPVVYVEDEGFEKLEQYHLFMTMYNSAIKEVSTKFEILNDDLSVTHKRNPIEMIKSRIKIRCPFLCFFKV